MSDKPQKIRHIGDYVRLRKARYPKIEDFIDAYYWMQRGKPELMEKYLKKVDEIKKSTPKLTKDKTEV